MSHIYTQVVWSYSSSKKKKAFIYRHSRQGTENMTLRTEIAEAKRTGNDQLLRRL